MRQESPPLRKLLPRPAIQRATRKAQAAARGCKVAGKQAQQARFTGAVGADEPDDFAGLKSEVDVRQHRVAPGCGIHALQREQTHVCIP